MSKLICIAGMGGAGKSQVAELIMEKKNYAFIRFGQAVLDEVIKSGQKPSEALERKIREELRAKHGMAVIAKLNIPKIDKLLKKGNVVADGLYSWEEYLELKNRYGEKLIVIAVYAPPKVRYGRLEGRAKKHGKDENLRFRSFTRKESEARDYAEIENLHSAGPIAMADYTIINDGYIGDLREKVDEVLEKI